jgi:hypothetical protein
LDLWAGIELGRGRGWCRDTGMCVGFGVGVIVVFDTDLSRGLKLGDFDMRAGMDL